MGILVGIIAKAVLLSLLLTAASIFVVILLKGDARLGLFSYGVGFLLFVLLFWQGTLLLGGFRLKEYEDQLVAVGEASFSEFFAALQDLPVPSSLREAILPGGRFLSGMEAVQAVRKATSGYIRKRALWMAGMVIASVLLMIVLKRNTPERKASRRGYAHYRSSEDF